MLGEAPGRLRGVVALLVVLSIVLAPRIVFAAGHALVGFVMDETGNPLQRAPITARGGDQPELQSLTNDAGVYCFADPRLTQERTYDVCTLVMAGKAACADGQGNAVAVVLLGRDGAPLAGRPIAVQGAGGETIASGRTDKDGLYCTRQAVLQAGKTYQVCGQGFAVERVAGGLSGWVFDATSNPLADAPVTLVGPDGQVILSARTGEEGHYCLSAGDIEAGVGYRMCVETIAVSGRCALTGALVDAAAQPIARTDISIEQSGKVVARSVTDRNGWYCVADSQLAPGNPYSVCLDRVATCTCSCGPNGGTQYTSCATEYIPVWPAAIPAVLVPVLTGGGKGGTGEVISPSK